MSLTLTTLKQAVRDCISDIDATTIFADAELVRHIAGAVRDFSRFRSVRKTDTVTLTADTTDYGLPEDCLYVLEIRNDDDDVFTDWAQQDTTLIVDEDLVEDTASLSVKYYGFHEIDDDDETYVTIPSIHEDDVVDLTTARCLEIMSVEVAKRPTFAETQVRVDYKDTSLDYAKFARYLRSRVEGRLNRQLGAIG